MDNNIDELLAQNGITLQESTPTSHSDHLSDSDVEEIINNFSSSSNTSVESTEPPVPNEPTEPIESDESALPDDPPATLPQNSPTLLVDSSTSRFSGTTWYDEIRKQRLIIAGLGGIGSHLAFNMARMSPEAIVLYDDDVVDASNMSGQLYGWSDIGRNKVNVVHEIIKKYTSATTVYVRKQKFDHFSDAGNIMMCGFDNMEARNTFYHAWLGHIANLSPEERKHCLFLDGRLSISVMQVFCITGDDFDNMNRYENEFLFKDSEADPQYNVCSLKQTTYLASMIGAMMTNLFTNFIANQLDPVIPYALPFFTEYDAPYMIFKTEY